ncbi:hypothetical protein Deba_1056 [Desulfarculus baarsii DSM 2075]|uniref:Uncharacterized protein n=1 Tax=Desulfarculus baarsii (strain ATCC 33931 / DSM 2075 / LMG 7858 / VKM B-1802 / 2st14) TaxID=644282 RepID=E1QIK1_DESB2|nr:hypothetical protein [Desulfarculus baarsii]ADK84424.1 hypothetical protein Deba_1056 [Desulfarculus baarsii DSM 2075]
MPVQFDPNQVAPSQAPAEQPAPPPQETAPPPPQDPPPPEPAPVEPCGGSVVDEVV